MGFVLLSLSMISCLVSFIVSSIKFIRKHFQEPCMSHHSKSRTAIIFMPLEMDVFMVDSENCCKSCHATKFIATSHEFDLSMISSKKLAASGTFQPFDTTTFISTVGLLYLTWFVLYNRSTIMTSDLFQKCWFISNNFSHFQPFITIKVMSLS